MNYIQIGRASFNVDQINFKTKSEFIKLYKNLLTNKELEDCWTALKPYIKVDYKQKKESE